MLTENSQNVSSGPESTKIVLQVREKASDVKMFSQTIITKRSKIVQITGRRLIGRYLQGSDLAPSFLKTGTTDEDFQQVGKQDSAKHLLYSLAMKRKLWRTHLKYNGWNSVMASGFGYIKSIDCTRNHSGSDILRADSQFSTKWKTRKLLGPSRVELHEKFLAEVTFVSRCCEDRWAIKKKEPLNAREVRDLLNMFPHQRGR